MSYEVHLSGGAQNHEAVRRLFAKAVAEARKFDPAVDARYSSLDSSYPDHVDHPLGGHTGENPQRISGNETEVEP